MNVQRGRSVHVHLTGAGEMGSDLDASGYTGEQIQHITDLEHLRARPRMYIGYVDAVGLGYLVDRLVANSLTEFRFGDATTIQVRINSDGSCTVEDNGRGISVDVHAEASQKLGREITTLEGLMTVLYFARQFHEPSYDEGGGLFGVGIMLANGLSEWCEAEVCTAGRVYLQKYHRGKATTPVLSVGPTQSMGTKITFQPDSQIFSTLEFDIHAIRQRLHELAAMNPGVVIRFHDDRTGQQDSWECPHGIVDLLLHEVANTDTVHHDVISACFEEESGIGLGPELRTVEIALQYAMDTRTRIRLVDVFDFGVHFESCVERLLDTVQGVLEEYGRKRGLIDDAGLTAEDYRRGLTAIVSFPAQYVSADFVSDVIQRRFGEFLRGYFERNPQTARRILCKVGRNAQGLS
jgi:DNA gyrase subunit B